MLNIYLKRNGLDENDVRMLKQAFDKLDESEQGSILLSRMINLATPFNPHPQIHRGRSFLRRQSVLVEIDDTLKRAAGVGTEEAE